MNDADIFQVLSNDRRLQILDAVDSVEVGGEVVVVGSGTLDVLPEEVA
jgi:hypothetical protein